MSFRRIVNWGMLNHDNNSEVQGVNVKNQLTLNDEVVIQIMSMNTRVGNEGSDLVMQLRVSDQHRCEGRPDAEARSRQDMGCHELLLTQEVTKCGIVLL
jgi:hypothetical protein